MRVLGLPVVEAQRRDARDRRRDVVAAGGAWRVRSVLPAGLAAEAIEHVNHLQDSSELRDDLVRKGAENARRHSWARSAERLAGLLGLAPAEEEATAPPSAAGAAVIGHRVTTAVVGNVLPLVASFVTVPILAQSLGVVGRGRWERRQRLCCLCSVRLRPGSPRQ